LIFVHLIIDSSIFLIMLVVVEVMLDVVEVDFKVLQVG
jgi:hypothetical protein